MLQDYTDKVKHFPGELPRGNLALVLALVVSSGQISGGDRSKTRRSGGSEIGKKLGRGVRVGRGSIG